MMEERNGAISYNIENTTGETTPLLTVRNPVRSAAKSSWLAELKLLTQYSLPLIATYLLQYSFGVITTFTAGHLSADDLAAASLAVTTMNIFGFAIFEGMATALDTLCAQAYGNGNKLGVGLHLQRMGVLMALVAVPIATFWVCSPWILARFVHQEYLAVKAGAFLRISILGMPGYASFEAGKRFLQAQGDFTPALVVLLICTPVNGLLSWLFAFRWGLGLEGVAIGVALANGLRPLMLLLYVALPRSSHLRECWGGLSQEALSNWAPSVQLSIAGAMVNIGEWAAFEILTLSTSYLSTNHLAANTILITISVVTWHIPFSISVAVSTRIGHLVGAGLLPMARRVVILYSFVFIGVGMINATLLFMLRDMLPSLFTNNLDVRLIASDTLATVALFQLVDAVMCGCNGMMRGLGYTKFAAETVFLVNYLGAVPLALWLELGPPQMGLHGGWVGLGIGMLINAAVEAAYMKTTQWEKLDV